jgi:membrane protease subunit (stomatin/prohibitin family)
MLEKIFGATRALYIARPDTEAQTLVFRHPDTTIPRGAKLTVRSDEEAVFFRQGRLAGILTAGPYVLDTANIPFLGGLVNVATGGNHYVAELFFVRTSETELSVGPEELGSFVDLNSRNLLRLLFTAHITLSVTDGVALITRLGGQSSESGNVAAGFVAARLRNCIKALVAERAQALPIYNVISNALTEELGTAVVARVAPEFARQGLRLDRFLELSLALDEESERLLRRYQTREADLVIDAKGAQIAADPGFATYNAVKGNRQVAEGLGTGLGKGMSGPLIGMGFGFGLGPGVPGAGAGSRGPSPSAGAADAGTARPSRRPDRFFVQASGMTEGPYVARQVALWIMARGGTPETAMVRVDGDPEDLWCPASAVPSILAEYSRRVPAIASQPSSPPPPPSPPAPARAARTLYAYWNGEKEERDLPPAEVAEKVRANEGGTNMVWAEGFGGWQVGKEVPEIAALLARMPPRPPG